MREPVKPWTIRLCFYVPTIVGFAVLAHCVKDNKGVGNDQGAAPSNKPDIHAGGNVWNFNFQSVQQSAGWGVGGLSVAGWAIAAYGRRRERQDFYKVADTLEYRTGCQDCKDAVKKLRDERINQKIIRRYHPNREAA